MESRFKIHRKEWGIALLVILNLLTLAALWLTVFHRSPGGPPPWRGGEARDPRLFLNRELNLTAAQAKEFDDLRNRFFKAARPLHDEIGRLKESLIGEMFRPQHDMVRMKTLIEEIGAHRADEEKRLLNHFLDMVNACRPDQKARFQAIIREFMTMIGALDPPDPPEGLPRPGDGPERGPDDGPGADPGGRPTIR
jgi:hypothetical protein